MRHSTFALAVLAVLVLVGSFRGQQTTSRPQRSLFSLVSIHAGADPLWPPRIRALDSRGDPTGELVEVRSQEVLRRHYTDRNRLLPTATFPNKAILPDGITGNQFLLFQFNLAVDVASVLISNSIVVLAYDPTTELSRVVRGRWFVGGVTSAEGNPERSLRVVERKAGGLAVVHPQGDGFPSGFAGDDLLGQPTSVVFVVDDDGNLRTPEMFPGNVVLRVIVGDVRSTVGATVETEVTFTTSRDRG